MQERSEQRKTICIQCQKHSENNQRLKRCTGCLFMHYCSADCQRQHWPSHKVECKKFTKQLEIFPSRDLVPLWYIHYCLNWIQVDEFLVEARKHQQTLLGKIKASFTNVAPVVDILASWIPSTISIDGNTKHLVVYFSYPYWNEEEQQENYSDQLFYDIFLVGPDKVPLSHHYGNTVIDSVKQVLQDQGITCRTVSYGCGFKNS